MLCDRCASEITERVRGPLRIDVTGVAVTWRGKPLPHLSRTAWLMLLALTERPGSICSRNHLIDVAFDGRDLNDRTVDVVVSRLRRTFKKIDPGFQQLTAEYSHGYRWGA